MPKINSSPDFLPGTLEMKKVSSGSRTEKPEKQSEAGAAKLMKPRIELNLSGRIGF
jgi:hypothetical protein